MTLPTHQPLLVDFSYARPNPALIKSAGYSGVVRYLSTDPAKNLTKPEAQGYLDQGLSISLVWESTAERALGGEPAGVADGIRATILAGALGYPHRCPIFFAVDFDATTYLVGVKAYAQGFHNSIVWPTGIYGSFTVCKTLRELPATVVDYAWQTEAWSNGNVYPNANLFQRVKPTVAHPIPDTDENVVMNDFPRWGHTKPIYTHSRTGSRGKRIDEAIRLLMSAKAKPNTEREHYLHAAIHNLRRIRNV